MVTNIGIYRLNTFIFSGVPITNGGVTDKDLRRRLAMGTCAMGSMKGIFKDRVIRLTTTIMIVQILVFPIILYGAETWTIKNVERGNVYFRTMMLKETATRS